MGIPRAIANRSAADPRSFFYIIFFIVLLIGGGASRADVLGQVIVRAAAWLAILFLILTDNVPRKAFNSPVFWFVAVCTFVVAAQLVPLPPEIWAKISGRSMFQQAAVVAGVQQPWRPLSISPSATLNALNSLVVPICVCLILISKNLHREVRILTVIWIIMILSGLLGLLQFAGAAPNNPLINNISGMVTGFFANRNHFALFMALGCLIAPVWAASKHGGLIHWGLALGSTVFFVLLVLASGSRMGLLLSAVCLICGIMISRKLLADWLCHLQPSARWTILVTGALMFSSALIFSIALGRALAIQRIFSIDTSSDLRFQALPTVWSMVEYYLPSGIGFGTFDAAYRIWEPNNLLQPAYFNHAHFDPLEWILEGGVAAAALLLWSSVWWARAFYRSTRARVCNETMLAQVGAVMILVIFLASLVDYPARTPIIMALLVISALWLEPFSNRNKLGNVSEESS